MVHNGHVSCRFENFSNLQHRTLGTFAGINGSHEECSQTTDQMRAYLGETQFGWMAM